MAIYLSH